MLGLKMIVELDGFAITLRPVTAEDLPTIAQYFDSLTVMHTTLQLYAKSIEDEQEWFDRVRHDEKTVHWGIQPNTSDKLIGVTSLHNINISGSCASGIIIFNKEWWGKGVATRAHLGRTLLAADYLNRVTIASRARTTNPGSCKALERVGYNYIGTEPCTDFRNGKYNSSNIYTWLHPEREGLLYPGTGWPDNLKPGIERAQIALDKARKVVKFP